LKLSEMSEEERKTMGRNGLSVSVREFDRGTLIDRLEGWIEQLKVEAIHAAEPRRRS
jgi:colanic acid biosynthesis glycosyl transferase WcaI